MQTQITYELLLRTGIMSPHLAFIYAYSRIFKRPPAEADMRHYFDVTAPSVHQMVMTLEKPASSRGRPEPPEAFNFWLVQNCFPFCAKTTRHNLCGTVLV